jgi:membrane protease YdiL (CAAX protease family)
MTYISIPFEKTTLRMKRTHAIAEVLLFFAAFFLPGYAAQGAFAPPESATTLLMLQSILTGVPQFLLMAWVATTRDGTPPARWGLVTFEPRDALRSLVVVLSCFAAVLPFVILLVALPPDVSRGIGQGYRWGLQSAAQIPVSVLFGLTAGYREEFFFRAYLLGRLDELGLAVPAAVAVSTAVFCLGHVYEGPLAVAVTAALGVVLSVAWLRRRSLHVVAIAHGLYNTLVLCLGLVLPRTLPQAVFLHIF